MITMMADPSGQFTEALGMSMTHPGPIGKLGGPRCKRHAMYVENGIVKALEIAESPDDPAGDAKPDVTLCENMMSKVPDLAPEEQKAIMAKIEVEKKEDIAAAQKCIDADGMVLFVKPSCVFSEDALEALMSNGIKPRVFKTTTSQRRGLQQLPGSTSMPSAWCKGKYIGGCNDGPQKGQGVKPMLGDGSLKAMLMHDKLAGAMDDKLAGA
jgi:glutaredoxin-related protein